MWDDNDRDDLPEEHTIREFEQMLALNKTKYFDAAQFEEMFDYYLRRNKVRKAEKTLEIGLDQHPYSVELKMRQCQLLIRRNQYGKALDLLDELDDLMGEQPELLMMRGEIYSDMQRHGEAAECLERAVNLVEDDDVEFLFIDIANEYFNDQKPDEAIRWLLKAVAQNPELDLAYFELYQVFRATERQEDGVETFNRLIDKDPYNAKPWYYLGLLYLDMDRIPEALESFDLALTAQPEYDEARLQKAETLMEQEHYDEALDELRLLQERDYRTFYVAYCMGECYEMTGSFHLAREFYRKSISLNENYVGPWLGMAVVYSREGLYREALPFIEKALKLDPHNPDVLLYAGLIYKALGRLKEAEEAYTELLEHDTSYEEAWLDLADIQYGQNRLRDCSETMLEALKANPDNSRLMTRLAGYLCLLGNMAMGIEILDTALRDNAGLAREFREYFPALSVHPLIQETLSGRQD